MWVTSQSTQPLKHIQCLCVVGDQHHLVICGSTSDSKDAIQERHLAWGGGDGREGIRLAGSVGVAMGMANLRTLVGFLWD